MPEKISGSEFQGGTADRGMDAREFLAFLGGVQAGKPGMMNESDDDEMCVCRWN